MEIDDVRLELTQGFKQPRRFNIWWIIYIYIFLRKPPHSVTAHLLVRGGTGQLACESGDLMILGEPFGDMVDAVLYASEEGVMERVDLHYFHVSAPGFRNAGNHIKLLP
jgi:hypothetical protein